MKKVKEYKNKSVVSGKTIEDITGMGYLDFISLDKKTLKQYNTRLVSAANKRIRRLKKNGLDTPALKYVKGGKFSVRGVNTINELRKLYARLKAFLTAKTSSVKGFNQFMTDSRERLKNRSGIDIEEVVLRDVYRIYDKLRDMDPRLNEKQFKYKVLERLKVEVENPVQTSEEIQAKVFADLDKIYEELHKDDVVDMSKFFEVKDEDENS